MKSRWVVGTMAAMLGCTRAAVSDEATGSDSTGAMDSSSDVADDAPEETGGGETMAPDTSVGDSSSSTTSAEPECGNGTVEPGEECDDRSGGCVDCTRVCGFELPIELALVSPSYTTASPPPVPIPDGTGDFAVASSNGIHRVTASGEELWLNTFSPTLDWVENVALVGDDELWVLWTIGTSDPWHARLTRHALDDGATLATVEVNGSPSAVGGRILAGREGELYSTITLQQDELVDVLELQRRTGDAAMLEWSSPISQEPLPADGWVEDYASGVALAPGGGFFLAGKRRYSGNRHLPLIAKLDAEGAETWQRTYDPEEDVITAGSFSPSPSPDGGLVFVAWRQYTSSTGVGSYPNLETTAMRVDADGETTWDVDLTEQVDSGRVQLQAAHALEDGRFIVAGALIEQSAGQPWIGWLDENGTLLCSMTQLHPSAFEAIITDIFADADGNLLAHGFADDGNPAFQVAEVRWIAPLFPY